MIDILLSVLQGIGIEAAGGLLQQLRRHLQAALCRGDAGVRKVGHQTGQELMYVQACAVPRQHGMRGRRVYQSREVAAALSLDSPGGQAMPAAERIRWNSRLQRGVKTAITPFSGRWVKDTG